MHKRRKGSKRNQRKEKEILAESKKEISKFIGDIFQKCGAKEAQVGGGDNYNYFKNHSDVS